MGSVPTMTVIIPSHRPAMLSEALASVLAQTALDRVKLLVTFMTSNTWGTSWCDRINALLPAITGTYTVMLQDDDVLLPSFVHRVLSTAQNTDADIISTDVVEFGMASGRFSGGPWTADGFRDTTPVWFSTAIRTSLFRDLGGLDPALVYQDWDLWYRAYSMGARRVHIPDVLWQWRRHGTVQGTGTIDPAEGRRQIHRKHPELAIP